MGIRAIAFDVHGTLAYWPQTRVRPIEVQRFLADFGLNVSYEAYDAARRSVLFIEGARRRIEGWMDFLALVFARLDLLLSMDLLAALAGLHERRDAMTAFDDAASAVQAAKEMGLITCVFTSLPSFMTERAITALHPNLDHYFDAARTGCAKGDPRFYRSISAELALPPAEIACVGDDPLGDCELPAEQGWRPVLLDRARRHAGVQAGQVATIESLDELLPILRDLRAEPRSDMAP